MDSMFVQINNISDHPSSSSTRCRYDVFLSFRGVDTRDNFSYYLYRAFLDKGIHTFRDGDGIEGGKQVDTELMKAIEESNYSIIVISQNYASSSWCLNELVRILECKETLGHTVYAIFYHVDPSNVRKQTGKFGEGFSESVSKDQMSAPRWKEALVEISGFKGWVYPSPGYGAELEFIDALVEDIFGKLKDTDPKPLEGLVGMTSRMDKVVNLLDLGSNEARMVGIWGMGGIGKTAIAKAVYHSISGQFEACNFIENVREIANRSGLKALQEQLISNILKKKYFELENVTSGTKIIRDRVCHKKVLIVLDDVDESIELENLIGKLNWFSNGSRVIITTRDRHMLTLLDVKDVYEVQELNMDESKELFISRAFAENRETREFRWLIDRAIEYAKGIPLALKVFGSYLLGLEVREWKSALDRLKESPGDKVQQVLRISYDGLHREDKEIFLDISCFFRGKDKDEIINVLSACGFNPDIGIYGLVQKSLLTISKDNTVGMHDLVQKMGQTIVQEESTKEPGKRSRLWNYGDIKHVLTKNTGTEKIEGIYDHDSAKASEDLKLNHNAFTKMTNMRVLKIRSTCLKINDTDFSIDLPNMLRYLHWHGYPLKCFSSTFEPEDLVELYLTHSRIEQIWNRKLVLLKLTVLDLSHSRCLIKSPDFTSFPNLEKLCLEGCTALRNLHPSVKSLKRLIFLSLKNCQSLKTVPYGIESQCLKILIFSGCLKLKKILEKFEDLKQLEELYLDRTSITEIPQSICNATNLWYLDLSRCRKLKRITSSIGQLKKLKKLLLAHCSSLNELPEEVGFVESLEFLNVAASSVVKLPLSVVHLRNLQSLSLHGCGLNTRQYDCYLFYIKVCRPVLVLPSLLDFNSLTSLNLGCCRLKSIPKSIFSSLSLTKLILNKNPFKSLPASIKNLSKLQTLGLHKCKNLQQLPELPSNVRYLLASGCESLTTICSLYLFKDARRLYFSNCSKLVDNEEIRIVMKYEYILHQIKVNGHLDFRTYTCPGSKIPKWFTYQNIGASLKFQLPKGNLYSSNLLGFALSAVVSIKCKECRIGIKIRVGDEILKDFCDFIFYKNLVDVFIFYYPTPLDIYNLHQGGVDFEVCFCKTGPLRVDSMKKPWTSLVDNVEGPALEVKSCGACLIYKDDLGSIVEHDKVLSVTSTGHLFQVEVKFLQPNSN